MLNRIVLIGRLTRDPELRYTGSGTAVCNFTLAVERNFKNKDGEREVDFINIVVWRAAAENAAKYLAKGRLTAVEGSLQIRKSESNNKTYINPEVVADNVKFLDFGDRKKAPQKGDNAEDFGGGEFDPDDIDVPF